MASTASLTTALLPLVQENAVIISVCWAAGSIIGFLPLLGWNKGLANGRCYFLDVMDYNFLVFLYFVTIITPALVLAAFYAHIYQVVLKQLRQIVTMNPESGKSTPGGTNGGTMLRMLGAAQKRDVKSSQNLSIIVLFFMICWIPLYTVNCVLAFCRTCDVNPAFMYFCIILSHVNSAVNPILYAYHLRDFRAALKHFLYDLFGRTQRSTTMVHQCRPSLATNNGIDNRFLRKSRSETILSPKTDILNGSQLSLSNKFTPRSATLPAPPKMSSIVANIAAFAYVPAIDTDREIWRISEHTSQSEESPRDKEISDVYTRAAILLNRKSGSESSGTLNIAYVGGPIDYEIGDDDVFIEDTAPITELTFENNKNEAIHNISGRVVITPAAKKQRTNCLSSSSPQLSRNLYFVDTDSNKEKRSKKFVRSRSVAEKNDKKFCISGEFVHSPAKSLKLSPLKVMGDFFFNQTSKHSKSIAKLNLSDDECISADCFIQKNSIIT